LADTANSRQTALADLKALSAERDEISESFQTFQGQVAALNKSALEEKSELKTKFAGLTRDLEEAKGRLTAEQAETARLTATGDSTRDEVTKLTAALAEATGRFETAESKSAADQIELTRLRTDLASLSENISEKTKLISEKQNALETLRSAVTDQTASSDSVIQEIKIELDEVTKKCDVLQWYVTYNPYYSKSPRKLNTFDSFGSKIKFRRQKF